MTRDFQRSKLYTWERSLPTWPGGADDATPPPLSLAECSRLIQRAAKRYGVAMPKVTDGRGARFARGSARRIKLPTWARTPVVVLHETAHTIAGARRVDDAHGPVFVRLMIQLWAVYLGWDEAALIRSARRAKLKVAARQPTRCKAGGRIGGTAGEVEPKA